MSEEKVTGTIEEILGAKFMFTPSDAALHLVGTGNLKGYLLHFLGSASDKDHESLAFLFDDLNDVKSFAMGIIHLAYNLEEKTNEHRTEPSSDNQN